MVDGSFNRGNDATGVSPSQKIKTLTHPSRGRIDLHPPARTKKSMYPKPPSSQNKIFFFCVETYYWLLGSTCAVFRNLTSVALLRFSWPRLSISWIAAERQSLSASRKMFLNSSENGRGSNELEIGGRTDFSHPVLFLKKSTVNYALADFSHAIK